LDIDPFKPTGMLPLILPSDVVPAEAVRSLYSACDININYCTEPPWLLIKLFFTGFTDARALAEARS
jgi:hypothetical protein